MSKPGATIHRLDATGEADHNPLEDQLDRTFFALSDPVRRAILQRLDAGPMLVNEIAAPFAISLQAVSRHIQVLVRAGLVGQERTGRINRCSLITGPIYAASLWINRYSKYWQGQFDLLAAALGEPAPRASQQHPRVRRREANKRKRKRE